jgi:hypothetical protein
VCWCGCLVCVDKDPARIPNTDVIRVRSVCLDRCVVVASILAYAGFDAGTDAQLIEVFGHKRFDVEQRVNAKLDDRVLA